jgi:NADPH-dependent ferric siderophore reductase
MTLLDHLLLRATVTDVAAVTPRMRRIRLAGASMRDLDWTPGQHVRVHVDHLRLRTYSVWDYRHGGHLDLGVFDHPGDGPGARWSRHLRVGQSVHLTRPTGRLVLRRDAPWHLFVGDETACPAFGAMLRELPATAPALILIKVDRPEDRVPPPRATQLQWIHTGSPDNLLTALGELDLPVGPGMAYLAGEARTCQNVRRHLTTERRWPPTAILVKPFWTPGKRGLD